MKIKTSELQGMALDWAVAQAVGEQITLTMCFGTDSAGMVPWSEKRRKPYAPSTNWAQGGPLTDKYDMEIMLQDEDPDWWFASTGAHRSKARGMAYGPSRLIAAMRAIVKKEFGDEVEIPDELLHTGIDR